MALVLDGGVWAFGGGTLVRAQQTSVRIVRDGAVVDAFDTPEAVQWLKVAPDGASALLYQAEGRRIERWTERSGVTSFAIMTGTRDAFGAGFLVADGVVLTLLGQAGRLRATDEDGRENFTANVATPFSFRTREFVNLPDRLVAILGAHFSDPCDTVVSVGLDALRDDPEAVQQALRARRPVWDRAAVLEIGPADGSSAVVVRDPRDEEVPDSDADPAELGDVENFAGIYVRDLATGALVERHAFSPSPAGAIAAGQTNVAVQVREGVAVLQRATGAVQHIPGSILDVGGRQIARLANGVVTEVVALDAVDVR